MLARLLMPPGVAEAAFPLLAARTLRGFVDGYIAVLLPAYLLALGLDSAGCRLFKHGNPRRISWRRQRLAQSTIGGQPATLLLSTALLMATTGLTFASISSLWPLPIVAFVGTLNPSSGDVSVFLPLEQSGFARRLQLVDHLVELQARFFHRLLLSLD